MHYLFGFSGRINRAKIWLFLLLAVIFEIAALIVAMFGFHWSHYIAALQAFSKAGNPFAPAPQPIPDPIAGTAWVAVAILAVMFCCSCGCRWRCS